LRRRPICFRSSPSQLTMATLHAGSFYFPPPSANLSCTLRVHCLGGRGLSRLDGRIPRAPPSLQAPQRQFSFLLISGTRIPCKGSSRPPNASPFQEEIGGHNSFLGPATGVLERLSHAEDMLPFFPYASCGRCCGGLAVLRRLSGRRPSDS